MSKSDLFEDATRVWKMLDEMVLNDPVGYRKFIDRQLKEGRKCVSPPEVRFVIKATLKQSKRKLFVNYCEWTAVPEAKTESSPIIVKCGEPFDLDENLGIALAFNPNVFVQHGFGQLPDGDENKAQLFEPKSRQEQNNWYQLIWLGLHYLEQEKQLATLESNSVICSAAPLRPQILNSSPQFGSKEAMLKSLGFHKRLIHTKQLHSPICENDPMDVLIQEAIREIAPENVGNSVADGVLGSTSFGGSIFTESQPFQLPQSVRKPGHPLIQELNAKTQASETSSVQGLEEVPIQWHAEVLAVANKKNESAHSNRLKVTFELRGVRSGSQCDLDITSDKLFLVVGDSPVVYKPLEITLPCKVDAPHAEAKFNAKREILTLLIPIVPSNP
ncbi:PIH1 domain-containing protein 2 [Fasciola hepatica]|uniref:PIH1 domain-containing protein 2 n=1 Tax=Fasciola hepatica TaxID=6192 RepID=A0A4E0RHS0_FASHE|nr:PIH1 domain-containing protein 2 [Fasciola hepatica]